MRLLILVCCFVAYARANNCNCKFEGAPESIVEKVANARLDGQKLRLDELETAVDETVKTMEKRIVSGKKFLAENRNLLSRLDLLEGSGCGKTQFQCGMGTHFCVSNLAMCDGHKDCPNGADEDEDVCELPFIPGTAFEGTFYGNNRYGCDPTSASDKLRFVVVKITRESFFKSFIKIHFYTYIKYVKDGENLQANYIDDGYYNIATRKLVVLPDEGEEFQVALGCKFDPGDDESCHGRMFYIKSKETCAELHMFKVKTTLEYKS